MGILNVTPDSFSDGGRWNHMDDALFHAQRMIEEGADILDIGGESTRPGYTRISDEEEISRVAPVIEALKNRFDIPISVDTYKSEVAKAAILAGADLINDIWGLKADKKMAEVIAKAKLPSCLMHNRETMDYNNFLEDVVSDLQETLNIAKKAGISKDTIILDPGVGFAKNYEQNLAITNHLEVLDTLGCPVLLGTSRKSMIGLTLDLPSDQREASHSHLLPRNRQQLRNWAPYTHHRRRPFGSIRRPTGVAVRCHLIHCAVAPEYRK